MRVKELRKIRRHAGRLATGLVAMILASNGASAWASPLHHPKRLLSLYTVDLEPLFKWWSKHEGPRPLTSWVRITGSIVGTNSAGWIVQGQVEKSSREREQDKGSPDSAHEPQTFILQTPPLEDLAEFEQLSSQLRALNAQRAALNTQETDTKNREQAVTDQEHSARHKGSRSRVLQMENRQLKQVEGQVKAQEKPLDQQIQELKARLAVYPNQHQYAIDCFALDLQRGFDHMPVYDHGRIVK